MLGSTACIVVSEPDFEEPTRSRPQLIPLNPLPTELLTLPQQTPGVFPSQTFDALLLSEDAGEDVNIVLLKNYGYGNPSVPNQPWHSDVGTTFVTAASLVDGPRDIPALSYIPVIDNNQSHDCDSVTMLVTHAPFGKSPYQHCPTSPDDVATLTWFVAFCENLGECDLQDCVPNDEPIYCPDNPQKAWEDLQSQ